MIITIKRVESDDSFKYDFSISQNNSKEDVRDLHLFCLSIVKSLVENNFKLNEYGNVLYDFKLEPEDKEDLVNDLNYISFVIYNERKKLDDDINELLK